MPDAWIRLGAGTYNVAYRNADRTKVLKIQKDEEDATDAPERSVRLWNEINPDIPPPASLASTKFGNGWICPFVEGRQSTDEEMARGLIEIYNRTGRIVADATAPRNFITTPSEQVICIDVGMAVRLQREKYAYPRRSTEGRRPSVVSFDSWHRLKDAYIPFFRECALSNPKTVSTVKALLFIQQNRPDIFDTSFLIEWPGLVKQLSSAYDAQSNYYYRYDAREGLNGLETASEDLSEEITDAMDQIREIRPINFDHIKESCLHEIDRYISSRGTLHIDGNFDPAWITRCFRNQRLTFDKVEKMVQLRRQIDQASSYKEIKQHINALLDDEDAVKSTFSSGLQGSLQRCLQSVEACEQEKSVLIEMRTFTSSDH